MRTQVLVLGLVLVGCGNDGIVLAPPTNSDGGSDVGTVFPKTCSSGTHWTGGDDGSRDMNPGEPCVSCHLRRERERAYFFMGTVHGGLHEEDLCNGAPSSETTVEIIDANGNVALTLTPRPRSGNFYSNSTRAQIALPYTARVRSGDTVREMVTPQTSGDCNSCHTADGSGGAPGRISLE